MINIIKNGRITEKSSFGMEKNVYTFDVAAKANKPEIAKAIFALYKVKPVKINVLNIPKKKVIPRGRGKIGTRGGGRKALVYLKKGDSIKFV